MQCLFTIALQIDVFVIVVKSYFFIDSKATTDGRDISRLIISKSNTFQAKKSKEIIIRAFLLGYMLQLNNDSFSSYITLHIC